LTLETARREVGDEVIEFSQYFTADSDWLTLRQGRPKLMPLLDAAMEELRHGRFLAEAEEALAELYGDRFEIRTWVDDENYRKLKTSLWTSYFPSLGSGSVSLLLLWACRGRHRRSKSSAFPDGCSTRTLSASGLALGE
jgi:hypothetical protein